MKRLDLIGQRFGRLTVINLDTPKKGIVHWKCQCDCGNFSSVTSGGLKNGTSQSCGCLQKELLSKRVNKNRPLNKSEYYSWMSMKARCLNSKHDNYKYYGGRGITICQEWIDSFDIFLKDMGKKPTKKHTIDRIDNNLGYYFENCKWSTKKEQASNQRSNRKVINTETNEVFLTVEAAAKSINIKMHCLYKQLKEINKNKTNLKFL